MMNNIERLTKDIIPLNYKLYIETDLENYKFRGTVIIQLRVKKATNQIILNSRKLIIHVITFNDVVVPYTYSDEFVVIETKVEIGFHIVKILYTGNINETMEGFYRSKYQIDGETNYMVLTQFETIDARQVFPCFDEPNFKATFDITIGGPINKTILCNTPIKYIYKTKMKYITFETTPVMSTYLVAFVIGDLEYVEKKIRDLTVRIYATPGNKEKLSFALEVTIKALEWYIDWFKIDYPLRKLDLVGVPNFCESAMENWGLITFRESSLFCDNNTHLTEKQEIVNTICHELAHQWFGNLVTMEWWTYLWLNESMATYFGWLVTDILFPEWKIWNKFMENEYMTALELDSLETSHPVEIHIQKAKDVQQIFDAISYSKGACLIRFLVNYIGMDEFRSGIQIYLKKHQYKNTISDDLWDAFGPNIKNLMQCWIKQTGYPIVCVYWNGRNITISQSRFYEHGPNLLCEKKTSDSCWIIPIELRYNDSNIYLLLDKNIKTFFLNNDINFDGNIMIDPKKIGFYRVKYVTYSNINNLTIDEKIHILDDNFKLSLSGYLDFTECFKVINEIELSTEKNYKIWNSLIIFLNTIYVHLRNNRQIKKLYKTQIMIPLLKPLEMLFDKLGWDNIDCEPICDYELRELVIEQLIFIKNYKIINDALHKFRNDNWLHKKSTILSAVGKYGTVDDYNKLITIYETNNDPQNIEAILSGLGSIKNPNLFQHSIDLISSNKIKSQDIIYYIKCLSSNKYTCDFIWNYITIQWNKLITIYPIGSSSIVYLVKAMGSGFMTEKQLSQYINFFKDKNIEGIDMAVNQTTEKIINRILTRNRILNDPFFKLKI